MGLQDIKVQTLSKSSSPSSICSSKRKTCALPGITELRRCSPTTMIRSYAANVDVAVVSMWSGINQWKLGFDFALKSCNQARAITILVPIFCKE